MTFNETCSKWGPSLIATSWDLKLKFNDTKSIFIARLQRFLILTFVSIKNLCILAINIDFVYRPK